MTKDLLIKIINDIPEKFDIHIILFNGKKINLKNKALPSQPKIKYVLEDDYLKVISSEDKRQNSTFTYVLYKEIATVESTGVLENN